MNLNMRSHWSQFHFQRPALMAALATTLPLAGVVAAAQGAAAQADPEVMAPIVSVTVTSAADGLPQPDESLTLREAIEVVNGTLPLTALSAAEQALVAPSSGASDIRFNLAGNTTIELETELSPISAPGVTVDGTTQPGYGEIPSVSMVTPIPQPVVALVPADGQEVYRGLTIVADNVTVRGLAFQGFSSEHRSTQTTPPADIFITHLAPPKDADDDEPTWQALYFEDEDEAPQGVVIEDNWLGLVGDDTFPDAGDMSAFGVFVFNGVDTVVQRNLIKYHEGSGIITGARAKNLIVTENTLVANGVAGMPDAIRLDGDIDGAEIYGNLMCGSDGSGVFMFKPSGSARIYSNDIRFNGRRLRRSAVYLMGNGHEVTDNFIGYQPGPGVSVTAYPRSRQNVIRNNQFVGLDGLTIDLGANDDTGVYDFQRTDGPNPPRNSVNRRKDTANAAINAPQFDAYTFPMTGGETVLTGMADPGSEIDVYTIVDRQGAYGSLNEYVTTVSVDEEGRFSVPVSAPEGTIFSAIATDARYGTSEPSAITALGMLPPAQPSAYQASCEIVQAPPEEPIPEPAPEEPLVLQIPRRIHFALDRSNISTESASVLDEIAAALQEYPFIVVEMEGHTDPRATDAYNQALGERRAVSARDYLLRSGIAPERMRIRSFGETQRATTGRDRIDYARDRRVEFIFLDTRGLDIIFEDQERDLQLE
ncbi:MAG: OmpA family protein [Cyanobacteria bacterium P01_A01_bin.105]